MSINAPCKLVGWFQTVVVFDDISKDAGIRRYHWLTAFFLKFCVGIVKINTEKLGVLYLNQKAFIHWKKTREVSDVSDQNRAVSMACAKVFRKTAETVWQNGRGKSFDAIGHIFKAEERLKDTAAVERLKYLKGLEKDQTAGAAVNTNIAARKADVEGFLTKVSVKHHSNSRSEAIKIRDILSNLQKTGSLSEQQIKWIKSKVTWYKDPTMEAHLSNMTKDSLENRIGSGIYLETQIFKMVQSLENYIKVDLENLVKKEDRLQAEYKALIDKVDSFAKALKWDDAEKLLQETEVKKFVDFKPNWKKKLEDKRATLKTLADFVKAHPAAAKKEDQVFEQANKTAEAIAKIESEIKEQESRQFKELKLIAVQLEKIKKLLDTDKDNVFAEAEKLKDQITVIDLKLDILQILDPSKKMTEIEKEMAFEFLRNHIAAELVAKMKEFEITANLVKQSIQFEEEFAKALSVNDFKTAMDKMEASAKLLKGRLEKVAKQFDERNEHFLQVLERELDDSLSNIKKKITGNQNAPTFEERFEKTGQEPDKILRVKAKLNLLKIFFDLKNLKDVNAVPKDSEVVNRKLQELKETLVKKLKEFEAD